MPFQVMMGAQKLLLYVNKEIHFPKPGIELERRIFDAGYLMRGWDYMWETFLACLL